MAKKYGTPGPRSLHPDVAQDTALAACGLLAQLLFDRLIALADDQGRLRGTVTLVRANCLPLVAAATDEAVEAALAELAAARLILRYDGEGEPLIQLRQWWRYQSGMRRAYPSKWPAPPDWTDWEYEKKAERDVVKGGPPQSAADRGESRASASAGAGANASASAPAAPHAHQVDDTTPRATDAYRAYRSITGRQPTDVQKKWIDDLCGQHDRQVVIDAMYAEPDPKDIGFLRRITDRLRGSRDG